MTNLYLQGGNVIPFFFFSAKISDYRLYFLVMLICTWGENVTLQIFTLQLFKSEF